MKPTSNLSLRPGLLMLAGVMFSLAAQAQSPSACRAQSGERIRPVVELYTSEGCSSCPPADRWLSRLKQDPSVVALAFHVDYWDSLGWPDRFASPAFTQRQAEQRSVNGARFSYTPQVVLQGRDLRDWQARPPRVQVDDAPRVDIALAAGPAGGHAMPTGPVSAPVAAQVTSQVTSQVATQVTTQVTAQVTLRAGAPQRLAAYWAVTEDGHRSAVKAGENAGEQLLHDAVVREWRAVPAWDGATTLRFTPATAPDPAHPRAFNLVVLEAASGRPLQALRLACP